ncbi:MAG: glycosyltransferase [Verrucomicrobia bacterium]|jgi:glycosyltransferase involved in cell wall biosynthesis|nr:glycosyltransferase [Verrucomicrobiota bacterium]
MKSLTIIIPTHRDESRIGACLCAIFAQDYPRELLQVLVVDDNPEDRGLTLARELGAEVVIAPHRSEDLKKPFAIHQYARGEIIGLLDSDNVIPEQPDWLRRMVAVFSDPVIWGCDTLYYTFRPEDTRITKYLALIGGDDPIASYLGVNDRYCYFTQQWTGAARREVDRGDYLEVELDPRQIPALGSNGFFFRKALFNEVPNNPFVHQVFVRDMVAKGHTRIAKVKQGLIHVQGSSFSNFLRKKIRRMKRRRSGELSAGYSYGMTRGDMLRTGLRVATIVLPVWDAMAGYRRKPTSAWWLHPIACICLLFIYAFYTLKGVTPVAKREA